MDLREAAERLVRALREAGFMIVDRSLEDIGVYYEVISRAGVSGLLSIDEAEPGKGVYVIAPNRRACIVECRSGECRGLEGSKLQYCMEICVEECERRKSLEAAELIEKRLIRGEA